MSSYRYRAVDLKTGAFIHDLPLTNVRYGRVLNGAGAMSGQLRYPVLDGTARNRELARVFTDCVEPSRRALQIERDGVIVWEGPIWGDEWDENTLTTRVAGAELWSVLRRRLIFATQTFGQTDQFDIVRTLLTHVQAQPGGDLGILTDINDSGVLRDRAYAGFEAKRFGEAVEQLAAVIDGFDFSLDTIRNAGVVERRLNLYYPRRGRPADQTDIVVELGRNITSLQWPREGTQVATRVHALGAGEGDSMLTATATAQDLLDAGYPLLEDSISQKDISILATLQGHADARLVAKKRPVELPKVTIRGDITPEVGSYICGDEIRVRIPPDMTSRFPDGLDTERRIVAYDVDVPDDHSGENVTLTLDLRFEDLT